MLRTGQWHRFKVRESVADNLRRAGAWESDGWFTAIWKPPRKQDAVGVLIRNGEVIRERSSTWGLMVVDKRGDNVSMLVGADAIDISFDPAAVNDLQPLLDVRHLPPEYTPRPDWIPKE